MCFRQMASSVFALVGGVFLSAVAGYGQPVPQPAPELPASESRPAIRSTLPVSEAIGVGGEPTVFRSDPGAYDAAPPRPGFQAREAATPVKLPFACVENRGQWNTPARYVARTSGAVVRFEKDAIVLHRESRDANGRIERMLARLRFEGASDTVILEGQKKQRGVYNYFLGNDRSNWRSRVPGYSELLYSGLYEGVDLRVRKAFDRLEYDVLLAPGADVSQVVIHAEGIEGLGIEADGSLRIDTNLGPIRQALPTTWQVLPSGDREPVACRYRKLGDTSYGFEVPQADGCLATVIDPGLEWSTLLGGNDKDAGLGVAVDGAEHVVVVGHTQSAEDNGFPVTSGAYDQTYNGASSGATEELGDVFICRFDPSQTGVDQLEYCTYLGGSRRDRPNDVVLDSSGRPIVIGTTYSDDFPTAPELPEGTPFQANHNSYPDTRDAFIARLSVDGDTLEYSTYFGGSGGETFEIAGAMDTSDAVTICGCTDSTDLPTDAEKSFSPDYNGGDSDGFLARLQLGGNGQSDLIDCTYVGGSRYDGVTAVAVNGSGIATVTGWTRSTETDGFPLTDSYDATYNGGPNDGFVMRLELNGSVGTGEDDLIYSTYLGGSGVDFGYDLAVDGSDETTVGGATLSSNFPTTNGAYERNYVGGSGPNAWDGDAILCRFSADGSDLIYSTYLGGTGGETLWRLAMDDAGVVTAALWGYSTDFPTTPGAYSEDAPGGSFDMYIAHLRFEARGHHDLVYSTYVGTNGLDRPQGIGLVGLDEVVVAGYTTGAVEEPSLGYFPTTSGAFNEGPVSGALDAVVFRLGLTCTDDTDCDTIGDGADNCVGIPNPLQDNADGDSLGDVCDDCPADDENTCNAEGSAAEEVDAGEEETVETPDGSVTIDIGEGELNEDTTISVTESTEEGPVDVMVGFEAGLGSAVCSYILEPEDLDFVGESTVTITLVCDVTALEEWQRDQLAIYEYDEVEEMFVVAQDSSCSWAEDPPGSGTYIATCTAKLEHFSVYGMLAPLDTDGDGIPDNFDGVVDNCPHDPNPGQEDTDGDGIGDACEMAPVPTVSEWGLVVTALLLLAGTKAYFGRRRLGYAVSFR